MGPPSEIQMLLKFTRVYRVFSVSYHAGRRSSGKHNAMVLHPSVRFVVFNLNSARRILNVTHQGAACDAVSVHFGLSMRRTDMLVFSVVLSTPKYTGISRVLGI